MPRQTVALLLEVGPEQGTEGYANRVVAPQKRDGDASEAQFDP